MIRMWYQCGRDFLCIPFFAYDEKWNTQNRTSTALPKAKRLADLSLRTFCKCIGGMRWLVEWAVYPCNIPYHTDPFGSAQRTLRRMGSPWMEDAERLNTSLCALRSARSAFVRITYE